MEAQEMFRETLGFEGGCTLPFRPQLGQGDTRARPLKGNPLILLVLLVFCILNDAFLPFREFPHSL